MYYSALIVKIRRFMVKEGIGQEEKKMINRCTGYQ